MNHFYFSIQIDKRPSLLPTSYTSNARTLSIHGLQQAAAIHTDRKSHNINIEFNLSPFGKHENELFIIIMKRRICDYLSKNIRTENVYMHINFTLIT